jgi:hypothetical protein
MIGGDRRPMTEKTPAPRPRCWACSVPVLAGAVEWHHVIPEHLGGEKVIRLCTPCHDWLDRLNPDDRWPFVQHAVRWLLVEHDPIAGEDLTAFRMTPREVRLFFLLIVKWMAARAASVPA